MGTRYPRGRGRLATTLAESVGAYRELLTVYTSPDNAKYYDVAHWLYHESLFD
jgi:hypothetical protein